MRYKTLMIIVQIEKSWIFPAHHQVQANNVTDKICDLSLSSIGCHDAFVEWSVNTDHAFEFL